MGSAGQWPKSFRKNPIDCSLCGQPTHALKGVCLDCKETYNIGKSQRALVANGEKQTYVFRQYEISLHFGEEGFYFGDLLQQLTGTPYKAFIGMNTVNEAYQAGRFIGTAKLLAQGQVDYNQEPYASIDLTPAQAAIVDKALRLIPKAIEAMYQKGRGEGSRFVIGMALGEVSIDDVNHWHKKLEKDKP